MAIRVAMLQGKSNNEIYSLTKIDPWFLSKLRILIDLENNCLKGKKLTDIDAEALFVLKQNGFSDRQIA